MSLQTIQLDSVLSQSAASDNGTGTWEILKEREKKKTVSAKTADEEAL